MIATGSELSIALDGARSLDLNARVVSLPCWELFDEQPDEYRDEVLPPSVEARVSIEAGVTFGWERYVGARGTSIGVDRFGASAPYERIYEELGLTAEGRRRRRRGAWPDAGRARRSTTAASHLREAVFAGVAAGGHEPVDLGVDTDAVRVDYPDIARAVGMAIRRGAGRARRPRLRLRRRRLGRRVARSRGSARRSATTRTPRTRVSSTTT